MFERISYEDLNARQKEQYNYQKASAILADYGFQTFRLTTDWKGADFIAHHNNQEIFIKVQLKGRLSFDRKYIGKDIWICFPDPPCWYLYPHDELMNQAFRITNIENTEAWRVNGIYNFPHLTESMGRLLEQYKLT